MSMRPFLGVFVGAAIGIALVISCGSSPGTADAADVCNCPAAEPPLSGRVVRVKTTDDIPGTADHVNIRASCPMNSTVLGGSCRLAGPSGAMTLRQSGIDEQPTGDGWYCAFGNSSAQPVTVTATAICLNPAP